MPERPSFESLVDGNASQAPGPYTGPGGDIRRLVDMLARVLSGEITLPVEGVTGGSQVTPSIGTAIGDGTVAAGKRYVEFIFSPDFAGSILGTAFAGPRDLSYSLPVLPPGDSYGAIPYTISAGSARIVSF